VEMGCRDTLGGVGFIFLTGKDNKSSLDIRIYRANKNLMVAVAYVMYGFVIYAQKGHVTASTMKLSVLSSRTALFLPIYTFLMWLSLMVPDLYLGLQLPMAAFEAYSFFSFFAMVVTNLGGPQGCVDAMRSMKRLPYCSCCCPEDAGKFYLRVTSAIFHMLTTRVVIVFITVISGYVGAKVVTVIFSLVSLALVANAFISLVMFCKYLECVPVHFNALLLMHALMLCRRVRL
jgi:hypothetical protein